MNTVFESNIPEMKLLNRGKVRDNYAMGPDKILMLTSDRLSAFDVVFNQPIPGKGAALVKLSEFWFDCTSDIVKNHLVTVGTSTIPTEVRNQYRDDLEGRCMVVKKAVPLKVECIVRGYITGSGWKDYQKSGEVCGVKLPTGLLESERLPQPIFTPSTKADEGHDENITFEEAESLIGGFNAERLRDLSISLYLRAHDTAKEKGIILADTKFEFGMYEDEIILIDEVLTPDSSRYWPADKFEVGRGQDSFDKQYVRDYVSNLGWNKQAPAPELPEEVIQKTTEKYQKIVEILTAE